MCAAFWLALRLNDSYFSGDDKSKTAVVDEVSVNTFRPEAPGPRAAVLKKKDDGHFWADAKVNDVHIKFMVDTGAKSVALTRMDAQRIGVKESDLEYNIKVFTAGGETRGAVVMLDEIKIGDVTVKNVGALVLETQHLQQSLLGMSFMSQLKAYEVRGRTMIIRGN